MKKNEPILYFLRSSEQHVLKQLLPLSMDKTQDIEFFGLSSKDLGVYTLVNNCIAGAVWIRKKDFNKLPILNISIKKEFQNQGIATLMLTQLFAQAGNTFEKLEVLQSDKKNITNFLSKFDFFKDGSSIVKTLKKVVRKDMYDDYRNCKWIDP